LPAVRTSIVTARGLPAACVMVALALRLYALAEANLWWDEALAVWAVRKTFVETTLWTAGDVHPPIYFWSLWFWIRLVGESEYVVRFLSVAYGTVGVALAYALGRRAAGPLAGLLATALIAVAPFEVWWSMELRMYIAAAAFLMAGAYGATRWLDERGKPVFGAREDRQGDSRIESHRGIADRIRARPLGWLALYVVAAVLAMHTVYISAAGIAAINLGVLAALWRQSARTSIGTWCAAQLAVALAHIPWLALAVPAMSSWQSLREPVSSGFVALLMATLIATGRSTELETARLATATFWLAGGVAAVVFGARHLRRRAGPSGAALLVCAPFLIVPPLFVWAATQPRAFFYTPAVEARYLLPFAGPVYVLVAALCTAVVGRAAAFDAQRSMGRMLAGAALALIVLGIQASHLPGLYAERRWTDRDVAMAQAVWTQSEPGDVALLVSGNRYPIVRYVYDRRPPPGSEAPHAAPEGWPESPLRHSEGFSAAPLEAASSIARAGFSAPPGRPNLVAFPEDGGGAIDEYNWQRLLEQTTADSDRVWLLEIERHLQDPDGRVSEWLAARRPLLSSEGYGTDALHLFGPVGTQLDGANAVRVARLAGPRQPVEPLVDGGPLEGVVSVALPVRRALPLDEVNVVAFGLASGLTDARRFAQVIASAELLRGSTDFSARPLVISVAPLATSSTAGGEARRLRARLAIPPAAAAGEYEVRIGNPVDWRVAGRLSIAGTAPQPAQLRRIDAVFDDIRLVAGGVPRQVSPGSTANLDLVWERNVERAFVEPVDRARTVHAIAGHTYVFAHVLGPQRADGGIVWAWADGPPTFGDWDAVGPDAGFLDRRPLNLPMDAPPGIYTIEVGLFDSNTAERVLPRGQDVEPEARRVLVGTFTVR
jgi:4-amino-4-deoxy-L-arabinose transferase-like glycosyltransferase